MKPPLPPIPRPASERWRDIRMRQVPVVVYLIAIGCVIYFWNTHWMPGTFTGEVQTTVANVASPQAGLLVEMAARQFDRVVKGQVIGSVSAQTPALESASLAALRADLQVMRARMSLDQQRNQQNYQQLRVDHLNQRVDLAIARSNLRFAANELLRNEKLHAENIVSQFDLELALDRRDALATEVKAREELVLEQERSLAALAPDGPGTPDALILHTISSVLDAQEEQFRQAGQTVLRSPIDGVVTKVYRNSGEHLTAGEPLVTISSERPEGIIGFIRQPVSFEPQAGDVVTVRSRRGSRQQIAEAQILKVGAGLELFTQPLRVRGFDSSQERGLPVLISLPEGLALYPGELVDLALKN